jgi:hypothetical protein
MTGTLLLLLAGCASWTGTWLFAIDPNVAQTGDCVSQDTGGGGSDGTYTITGDQYTWVDIYQTDGGQYVVLIESALVGEASGNTLEASWSSSYQSDTWSESESIDFEGALDAGTMSGTVVFNQTQTSDDDAYSCTSEYTYTATRNVSDRDRYAGN